MVTSTGFTLATIDSSSLLNYYSAQLQASTTSALTQVGAASQSSASSKPSATANDVTPWSDYAGPAQEVQDAKVLGLTDFLDTSNVPRSAGSTTDSKTEQDNQKLFSLYTAINNLAYLAKMSQRDGMTSGQLAGFNTRFQQGLSQVKSYLNGTSFNNFTMQMGQTSSSVTSSVSIPFSSFDYQGGTVVSDAKISDPLAGISSSDGFTVSIKKGGTTTNVGINFANISGPLTLDNIVNYANQQLQAAGFSSRFKRVMTQGSIDDPTKASYGISISEAPSEAMSLSSAGATPALYLAGNSGVATATDTKYGTTTTTTEADQQGRLIKLSGIASGNPTADFNATLSPTTGNSTAASTVVDSNGNIYTVGTATGDFGNELNQGTQDVVLTKYDSAGNLQWSKLLGSSGSADAYQLAVDSKNNIIVAGSTTANLTPSGIANGSADTYVAKYDADGNQSWIKQIPTLATNGANSVSVDASGNIYIGGQVQGTIGKGQVNNGSTDGYVAKLDGNGNIQYEQQLGTSGADQVSATAVAADGSLYVASMQNGHAILSKYAGGDATQPATWTQDLGALQNGGSLGGLAVSGNKVYLSGASANAALTSGGQASVVGSTSGGLDAFVASFTDNGTSASADTVTYVGTSGTESAGQLTVDGSGNVYLTGTTSGTFAGQIRNAQGTQNAFVTALDSSGNVSWTRQYGGASGTSTGAGIAIDTSGSSVLDALGLPRGQIDINQSVDLTSATTLRPGSTFQIKMDTSASSRTATITIDAGETLQSLANKINNAMVFAGKASVTYANGGHALKIEVNKGVSATLIAGKGDLDALGRLGIQAGTIANGVDNTSSNSDAKPVYGLDFSGQALAIDTKSGANLARAELLNVLNAIRNTYRTTNTATSTGSTSTAGNTGGTASSYTTSQIANYQLALNTLSAFNSTSTQASTTGGSSYLGIG